MNDFDQLIAFLNTHFPWVGPTVKTLGYVGLITALFSVKLQHRLTDIITDAATNDDTEDDLLWERILASKRYRVAAYLSNYLLRIKLPRLADFEAMKKKKLDETSTKNQNQ